MVSLGQIVCKTVGIGGAGLALYDAVQISKLQSRNCAHSTTANYLEDIYYNSRTIDNVSVNQNNIRKKTFDAMAKLSLPTLWGKIKGACQGFIYSLSNSLPLVACSALAILGKKTLSKIGAIGVGGCLLYSVLRNGFGVGKQHPMR